jgi:hypothetical protein
LHREAGWKDNLVFSEYFYGDNGAGLGAAHQTEPLTTRRNGLIAGIIRRSTRPARSPASANRRGCDRDD